MSRLFILSSVCARVMIHFFFVTVLACCGLIAKDRVLGHNPIQALYAANGMYSRVKDAVKVKNRAEGQ